MTREELMKAIMDGVTDLGEGEAIVQIVGDYVDAMNQEITTLTQSVDDLRAQYIARFLGDDSKEQPKEEPKEEEKMPETLEELMNEEE